jgi:alpha-acetolactate decarboxylase
MSVPIRRLALAALPAAFTLLAHAGGPGAVRAYGNFKHLSHRGDASSKVALRELPATPGNYAVGALEGLRGEIVMLDGKLLVTRGHSETGRTEAPATGDAATLLALAQVPAWREVTVPVDLKQAEFEAFVVKQASAQGIATTDAFVFRVRGEFPQMTWHVVIGGVGGGHGTAHTPGHARSRVFEEPGAKGVLVGFHSGSGLEGVITHPGERFHLHYATADASRSGHVDAYAVRAGSVLLLPLP